jgi:hypothetical protein
MILDVLAESIRNFGNLEKKLTNRLSKANQLNGLRERVVTQPSVHFQNFLLLHVCCNNLTDDNTHSLCRLALLQH